jgi:AraC-like DNA-binding protein/mannose-6-phosphate isomerase-like protein (cupin superfamily)
MNPETTIKKQEGFQGQKAIILPRSVLASLIKNNDIVSPLYITDIGYYPKAKHHFRERKHGADQHILIYCIKGNGRVTINDTLHEIGSGEFVLIPAKTPHVYEADDQDPWTIHWIHFKGSVSNSIVATFEKQAGSNKGSILASEKIVNLFDEMYHQLERGYSIDNIAYTNMCFWHFMTLFLFNNRFSASAESSEKDPSDLAIDYMSKHIDKPLTLEEVARQVNFSTSHFSSLFKKKTGHAPMEYFNHLKIQKACQYLLFTGLRIKEVAQGLGFEDPYYFSRLFTKVMGVSPALYREKRSH